MSSDISSVLNIENLLKTKSFLCASKDLSSDLNFLFGDILSHCIKKNFHVIIVNLAQSYGHYTHLLLKSGVNIRILRDPQKLTMINVLSEVGNLNTSISNTDNVITSIVSNSKSLHCLKPLYDSIKNAVEKAQVFKPDGFFILIDEISLLMNLGVPLQAIQPFVQYCYSLCTEKTNVPSNLLMIGSFLDRCDEDNVKMVTYLSHLADVKIHVECLKTGYSKDTHGKITVEVTNKAKCATTSQKQFFKVGDKGAKLLMLGV